VRDQAVHHYPPELVDLLINAIPRLIKSKQGVLDFFRGCGVAIGMYNDLQTTIRTNKNGINKFEIVRQVLGRLNDADERCLRERREILRRLTQWDDFSRGWDSDRVEAEGYVAKLQKLIDVKDSFSRMQRSAESAQVELRHQHERKSLEIRRIRDERREIQERLTALFVTTDAHARGLALETVLNDLFKSYGISVREAFRRTGEHGEGVIEQVDGVVELHGEIYLVEMKWWTKPLGPDVTAQHLVRVFNRNQARGILISYSDFTEAAVQQVRESLSKAVFVLVELREIVMSLERELSLPDLFSEKVRAAVIDKNPLFRPSVKMGQP